MRLAISNIAWEASEDEAVSKILHSVGIQGIEIAPTKVWSKPIEASEKELLAYRDTWHRRGFEIVALQSLIFGRPDLMLFGETAKRDELREHLFGITRIAAVLGAKVMVFGSPKNRSRGTLPIQDALAQAVPFFREIGEYAEKLGTCLCIEANAPQYGCDFITTSSEACELVQAVDSKGFGLHLDLGNIEMAGEDVESALDTRLSIARHFHLSAPRLAPPSPESLPREIVDRLNEFPRWVSIEMLVQGQDGSERLETIRQVTSQAASRLTQAP